MAKTQDYIEALEELLQDFEKLDVRPVLVGGMALVLLGSQRVTRDFDLLISRESISFEKVVEVLYKRGFELISKFSETGEVLRTIDNPKVAVLRFGIDSPSSVYFYNSESGLKVDFLLDFPIAAKEIAANALKTKLRNRSILVASRPDLIRLKKIALAERGFATDAQDLEFLRKKLERKE